MPFQCSVVANTPRVSLPSHDLLPASFSPDPAPTSIILESIMLICLSCAAVSTRLSVVLALSEGTLLLHIRRPLHISLDALLCHCHLAKCHSCQLNSPQPLQQMQQHPAVLFGVRSTLQRARVSLRPHAIVQEALSLPARTLCCKHPLVTTSC
jgi:hypothetical protein